MTTTEPHIYFSAVTDGSMSRGVSETERDENRKKFLAKQGIPVEQAILVHLKYEGDNYRRYHIVGAKEAGDGIVRESTVISDALFTQEKEIALLLPVADCIGAVLYDARNGVLGLAHLGRHNLIQYGGTEVIQYMKGQFGSKAADIHVWLSPAAGKSNYPLYDFDNQSLHDVVTAQLLAAGVPSKNIIVDSRDTTTDEMLFSHSEFLKGTRETDGRQAVVAQLQ